MKAVTVNDDVMAVTYAPSRVDGLHIVRGRTALVLAVYHLQHLHIALFPTLHSDLLCEHKHTQHMVILIIHLVSSGNARRCSGGSQN
jgi:hypothetical protein